METWKPLIWFMKPSIRRYLCLMETQKPLIWLMKPSLGKFLKEVYMGRGPVFHRFTANVILWKRDDCFRNKTMYSDFRCSGIRKHSIGDILIVACWADRTIYEKQILIWQKKWCMKDRKRTYSDGNIVIIWTWSMDVCACVIWWAWFYTRIFDPTREGSVACEVSGKDDILDEG